MASIFFVYVIKKVVDIQFLKIFYSFLFKKGEEKMKQLNNCKIVKTKICITLEP